MLPRIAFSDTEASESFQEPCESFQEPFESFQERAESSQDLSESSQEPSESFQEPQTAAQDTIDPTSMIFKVLDHWAKVWPKSIPEAGFSTFWTPRRKYGQNRSQKYDFRRFGPLGGSMAKIDPMSMFFDVLDTSAEVWPKSIFDVLDPSAEVWPKSSPEARF